MVRGWGSCALSWRQKRVVNEPECSVGDSDLEGDSSDSENERPGT